MVARMMAPAISDPTAESAMTDDQLRIVCAAARRYHPCDVEIEDWMQTMVMWILGHAGSYDPERGAYSTWVYQIVRRERGHHIRRRIEHSRTMRVSSLGRRDVPTQADTPAIEESETRDAIGRDIHESIRWLLPHERYAVAAHLAGEPFSAAGERIGRTRAAISLNWRSAKNKMKIQLRRLGHGRD